MKNQAQAVAIRRAPQSADPIAELPVASDSDAPVAEGRAVSLLTVQAAAQRLALSRSMLYNLMERGDFAYVKIGRARRIPLSEVERLVHESLIPRRNGDTL